MPQLSEPTSIFLTQPNYSPDELIALLRAERAASYLIGQDTAACRIGKLFGAKCWVVLRVTPNGPLPTFVVGGLSEDEARKRAAELQRGEGHCCNWN